LFPIVEVIQADWKKQECGVIPHILFVIFVAWCDAFVEELCKMAALAFFKSKCNK